MKITKRFFMFAILTVLSLAAAVFLLLPTYTAEQKCVKQFIDAVNKQDADKISALIDGSYDLSSLESLTDGDSDSNMSFKKIKVIGFADEEDSASSHFLSSSQTKPVTALLEIAFEDGDGDLSAVSTESSFTVIKTAAGYKLSY